MRTRIRKRNSSRKSTTRRGAAAVEFAVVAPLFLLLLAGMVEFGQAFRIEHALANACRRGARAGICDGSTTSAVTGEVKEQCSQSLGVNEADVAVAVKVNGDEFLDLSKAKARDEIAVTVSIPFSDAGAGFFANMFSNSTLSSTTILEHE